MDPRRYDVLVVGAGPAGSIAALVLARAGARVALLDKARFPRDKACGDFIGPRGLQVLADLGVPEPPGLDVGDMVVVGPTGRRVLLPCFDGTSYPGRARAVTRTVFDDALRAAALEAGAVPVEGRAAAPIGSGAGIEGFEVADGHPIRADFVIGADGATSHVAHRVGLVEEARVLWGFAVRCYVDQAVELPAITLWEPTRWQAFPGYGWIFPGPDGVANVGVGVGTLADRQAGSAAVRVLPAYLRHLTGLGLLDRVPTGRGPRRLGGWLKMGMVGTVPAAGRVLLVGDAAGLVNPLQGEGIAQAMTSGRAAAESVLGSPGRAAEEYRHGTGPDPPALSAHHRRRPRRAGGAASGGGRGGAAADRPGGGPGAGRRMGHLLERTAGGVGPGPGQDGGRGIDAARGHGDRPDPGGALVRRRLRAPGMSVAQPVVRCRLTRAMPSPHEFSWSAGR